MTAIAGLSPNTRLLLCVAAGVLGLIFLIAKFKLNSILALVVTSLFVGAASGMDLPAIATAFQQGVGKVLGDIAMVVGLGTVLGKLLAESGGAQVVADTLIRSLGERRLHWAMMLMAFVVGIPVFFGVGLVLLVPILFAVARQSKTPLLMLGIPMIAALSVVHGLVPPHPGPLAAIASLNGPAGKVDLGKVILLSLVVGFPVAVITGTLLRKFIVRGEVAPLSSGIAEALMAPAAPPKPPGFALTIFTIVLPVILMLLKSAADVTIAEGHPVRNWAAFVGNPLTAMAVATLFALWSFGSARGFSRDQTLKFTNDCLGPAALILLVVGAGGGFNGVLIASGAGKAIHEMTKNLPLSPLLLGWLAAALIRVATGSATVAIQTASGLMAGVAAGTPGVNLELLVLAMGAGSLILSHVNDGGFWLVKEYLNLTVPQTLRTWTVLETILSVLSLLLVLLLNLLL
jgi:GntP family gluconate:H+ symporter